MTLSTNLYIIEPTNPRKVFDFCLALLAEDFDGEPQWDYTRKGEGERFTASTSHYATTCGQGLAAWLFVHHADDGPLMIAGDEWEEDEVPPPCNEHCVRINWDTAYSFRGRQDERCGDLHARMVATVGHWLDEQGLTWWWHDEFTGEHHQGVDGLDALGNMGDNARSWFSGTVLPAITSIL